MVQQPLPHTPETLKEAIRIADGRFSLHDPKAPGADWKILRFRDTEDGPFVKIDILFADGDCGIPSIPVNSIRRINTLSKAVYAEETAMRSCKALHETYIQAWIIRCPPHIGGRCQLLRRKKSITKK